MLNRALISESFRRHQIFPLAFIIGGLLGGCAVRQEQRDLAVTFDGPARIEVGGPFVGAEFHNSYPVPQRISFFYPIANSIDQSNDYWTRDSSVIMTVGLQIGDNPRLDLSRLPTSFNLTPFNVGFSQNHPKSTIEIDYQFCQSKPAMVVTISVTNTGSETELYQLDTRLTTALRTCHTFRRIETGWTSYDEVTATLITRYTDEEVSNVCVFVMNGGAKAELVSAPVAEDDPSKTAAAFRYQEKLAPGATLQAVQVIGSCYAEETNDLVEYLSGNYRREVEQFETAVLVKASNEFLFDTGDNVLNHSAHWAKSTLAVLDHYLDGEIVPMPCPAEYNFYFTHDALVTDLAAVNFDLPRVRRDLEYLLKHANDQHIIPHAYYWKDGEYRTEYADSNNWNHFWFIQTAASYLRHSDDLNLLRRCYPYLSQSLEYALHSREDDGLLYAYYLDGWDIGHNFGPRAFMTIMALKGIRDYVYISTVLGENSGRMVEYEQLADEMEQALAERLWNEEAGYLINYYENGDIDPHYYAGSLLAAHFGLLDQEKSQRLIATATTKLVDPAIGVYTVYPPDFHLLGDFLKFKGDEVGPPYVYANGAVWNHCNAWYALGLMAGGERAVAHDFIRRIMTIDGIMNSPNGQPAMYEYRNSNQGDTAVYGRIDKPQFLWAAGWYLYALYHLYGVEENSWNIAFQPYLPAGQQSSEFDLTLAGRKIRIAVSGEGEYLQAIRCNSTNIDCAVFSPDLITGDRIELVLGSPETPYLAGAEAIVESCVYQTDRQRLDLVLAAFPGHRNTVTVVAPVAPQEIYLDGQPFQGSCTVAKRGSVQLISLEIPHNAPRANVTLHFAAAEDNQGLSDEN
ncbi:MAG: amylo-alpha-1,6-glucosidase [Candidatus Neomarinimicrobiota bacterium]